MAEYTKTPLEELQEKLTSAIKENTRAQAETMKASTDTGKEIRRLQKDTAQQQKRAAFMERDLKGELDDALFAPFAALGKMIPKPLKILASMPVQAMMGAGGGGAPRVDPSGTPIDSGGGGVLSGAFSEAMGREISTKGYLGGMKAMVTPGGLKDATDDLLGILVDLGRDHTQLLEDIAEALAPKRQESLGKGSGFREPGIESKIIDPKTGKPFGARGAAAGGGALLLGGGGAGGGGGGMDLPPGMETGLGVGGGILGASLIKKLFSKGGAAGAAKGATSKIGVVALLTSVLGVAKDTYDLTLSRNKFEERYAKGSENTGAILGALIGALPFFIPGVGPLIGGMTMFLGASIGEMLGKAIDAERDPKVIAQMGALGKRQDELNAERKELLDREMDWVEKGQKLTAIREKMQDIEDEVQDIEERENDKKILILQKERAALLDKKQQQGEIALLNVLHVDSEKKFIEDNKQLLVDMIQAREGIDATIDQDALQDQMNRVTEYESTYYTKKQKSLESQERMQKGIDASIESGDKKNEKRIKKLLANEKKRVEQLFGDDLYKEFDAVYASALEEQQGARSSAFDAEIKRIDKRLGILDEETDEAADMVDWKARFSGADKGYNEQRTATDVGPGLHDVPAGKGFGQHAQELMAGKEWEEFDPTQTKGAKAMQAMFGETSGLRPDFTKPGAVAGADFGTGHARYTSDAYKAASAASMGTEMLDEEAMALTTRLSRGGLKGSGVGDQLKYSQIVGAKELLGGYDETVSHTGEKFVDPEKRRNLGLEALERETTGRVIHADQWTEAMSDDETMARLGGPKTGEKLSGSLSGAQLSEGALGWLNELIVDIGAGSMMQSQRRAHTSWAGGSSGSSSTDDTLQSGMERGLGSGAITAFIDRAETTEITSEDGALTETAEGLTSVMFQTYKDGMYEISYGIGEEMKVAAGQIKTKADVENVIQNLADMTGLSLEDEIMTDYKESMMANLKTGRWGMQDIKTTGRFEQGSKGSLNLSKEGKEYYAGGFSRGGRGPDTSRMAGFTGATGTASYQASLLGTGTSAGFGEARPADLIDPDAAWRKTKTHRWEREGAARGGRGSEDASRYLGQGGTKPYMTTGGSSYVPAAPPPALSAGPEVDRTLRAALDPAVVAELLGAPAVPRSLMGTTTYALPPSTGVKATALADPYEGRQRDPGGRLIHEPQYRPAGVSDMENYPDYYWKQFGDAGHDPTTDDYSKAMGDYKKAGPTATPVALDEMTQEEIAEADKTTAQVLTDVKIGTKSSLGVTLVDASGKVIEMGQSLTKQSDVMYQSRMGGGEFTPEASAEERLYGGLGGMMTKIGSGKIGEITDKELVETQRAATDYQSEIAQVLSDVKVGAHSSLGVTIMDAAGTAAQFVSGILLAGGKEGDPLGQKTYAAHGQAGSLIKEQSLAGELGDPRGPGGYHESTGEDIAKQVEGSWHDYGMGMTVPLGLLASQLSSEFAKSLFREDETFAEALKDPLGVVTAFKDASANIRGLRKGGYKTTSDLIEAAFSTTPASAGKRQIVDQAAAASSGANAGGGTNVIVNAPTTANSNSTVQKIDANPLMSSNPRRPAGVNYG